MLVETWQSGRRAEFPAIVAAHLRCDRPADGMPSEVGQRSVAREIGLVVGASDAPCVPDTGCGAG